MGPIPDFDYNFVLPPHKGNPTKPADLSPYQCTSLELCQKFASSNVRINMLKGFLSFRNRLNNLGLVNGFQWLDGSFLENIEISEKRSPNDLDLVTIYWGYDSNFKKNLVRSLPEFADSISILSKQKYSLYDYPFDASISIHLTVGYTRYWIQLFSHNRDAVWKGMLQIKLNTPEEDAKALHFLNTK